MWATRSKFSAKQENASLISELGLGQGLKVPDCEANEMEKANAPRDCYVAVR